MLHLHTKIPIPRPEVEAPDFRRSPIFLSLTENLAFEWDVDKIRSVRLLALACRQIKARTIIGKRSKGGKPCSLVEGASRCLCVKRV